MLQVTLELNGLESDVLNQQATAGSEEDVSEGFLPSKSSCLIVTRLVDRARQEPRRGSNQRPPIVRGIDSGSIRRDTWRTAALITHFGQA